MKNRKTKKPTREVRGEREKNGKERKGKGKERKEGEGTLPCAFPEASIWDILCVGVGVGVGVFCILFHFF